MGDSYQLVSILPKKTFSSSNGHNMHNMDLFGKLRKMKILLIEDDEWIKDSLSLFFDGEGCDLLALDSAEEGIEALKRQNYDIIIVDYRLPGMSGLDFLKRIQESHAHFMKILITAYGSDELVAETIRMGVLDVIEKPFSSKTIEEALSRLIENREKEREQHETRHPQDTHAS
jgi:DNA-binding NtrC family response regulator